ncbi:hypothetical protein Tsubulata_037660 [Turnera subulata]|uniref:Uncharacterized protein n=1 Tax=Turnera subulata TaxID=218843 RepID=A0A9Q0FGF5_9ROSI|nr:hypothetical protein Tsubulata_037660 [Turnera subulata]
MCYKKTCASCGKTTWGGCGKHVQSVYKGIPQGQHCLCHEWPGIDLNNPQASSAAAEVEPSSSCTIL